MAFCRKRESAVLGHFPQSYDAYGFTIEVHSGGRRVWPPSFKRFIKSKLDRGEQRVGDVMKECNVSQSLVFKWRADVKASRTMTTAVHEERFFSEVLIKEDGPSDCRNNEPDNLIHLSGQESVLSLLATYLVDDLLKIILALEGRA